MPYPAVQAVGTVVHSNTVAVSPAWPAHAAGDIGVLLVCAGGYATRLSTPAGFEELHVSPQREGPDDNGAAQLNVYWKRATGAAEAAPTVEFVKGHVIGVIFTVRGAAATGRPFTAQAGKGAPVSTAVSFPSVDTTDAEQLVINILANSVDVSTPPVSGWTNANLLNLTEHLDYTNNVLNGEGIAFASGQKAVAGTVGATTATLSFSSMQGLITLAFSSVEHPAPREPRFKNFGVPVEIAATGTISPAWPAHVTGDIGILVVESGNWPITFVNQQGFAEVAGSPQNAGPAGGSGSSQLAIFWKRAASGAEPAPVINWPGSQHIRAFIVTVENAITAGDPIDVSAGSNVAATSSVYNAPGGTTTKPNCLVMLFGSHSFDNIAPDQWSGWDNSDLKWLNERFEQGSNIGNGSGFAVATGVKEAAGLFTNTTATLRAATYQGRIMAAIKGLGGLAIELGMGSFVLTGQPITMSRSRHIGLQPGLFVLTGQNINLVIRITRLMALLPGSFTLTGFPIDMKKTSRGWSTQGPVPTVWTKQPPLEI